MRKALTAVAAFLALLLTPAGLSYADYPSLNETASWMAQRKVTVQCLTPEETAVDPVISIYGAAAYVNLWRDRRGNLHPVKYTVFAYGYCETLNSLPTASDANAAAALLILTHESGHLRGHRWSLDEAKTECWAIRHVRNTAAHMGVDVARLDSIVRWAVLAHHSLPPDYQVPGCILPNP